MSNIELPFSGACKPVTLAGYSLLQQGVESLAIVENNGMCIDTAYVERQMAVLDKRIRVLKHALQATQLWHKWRKAFGSKANLTSHDQLGHMLFVVLGHPVTMRTESGQPSTDEDHLQTVKSKFVAAYVKLMKLSKLRNTYLKNIQLETMDGKLHPFFNLHIARTFRSSSDSINFQNQPTRDPEMGRIVRRCFVARKNHVIVEADYSGIEVRVAACYHKDPNMLRYIKDTTRDMHRDMAMQIYKLPKEEMTKALRSMAKSGFVFSQFYGDYYVHNAELMWDSIQKYDLKTASGVPLRDWLGEHGIVARGNCDPKKKPERGTFERHMQEVENDFWNNRFAVYGQWRKDWYAAYLRNGYFDTYTGFRFTGRMNRKQAINAPVQGSAFHCLLWSLNQVVRKLPRACPRSYVTGQIHDSLVGDVHINEIDAYLRLTYKVMTEHIKEWAPWLNVPLDVEADVTPVNGTWWDKQPITYNAKDDTFSIEHKKTKEVRTSSSAQELIEFITN